MIQHKINWLYRDHENRAHVHASKLRPGFYKFYSKLFDQEEGNDHRVSSFEELGMYDPTVKKSKKKMSEHFAKPTGPNDLVYKKSRYIKGESPKMIMIPTKKLLFQIMRACVGVKFEEDLWFNHYIS